MWVFNIARVTPDAFVLHGEKVGGNYLPAGEYQADLK